MSTTMPLSFLRGVLLGALVILVTGCVVGPDYRKPASALTADLQGAPQLTQRTAQAPPPALDQWWLGFDDPALVRIVQQALDDNLDLAVALARVEQARAIARQAGAIRLPQVSLDGNLARQRQSLKSPLGQVGSAFPGYDREQTLQTLGIGASWEADLAGGLKRNEEAAIHDLRATEATRIGVRIAVSAEAADAYFRIRGAQRRIAVAEEQVQTEERLVSLIQDRFRGGLSNNRELSQAQALLYEARTTVPPLRTELAVQLNRLDVLMGKQPGTMARALSTEAAEYKIPAIAADVTPETLLRRRPDVIAAEQRLAGSNARVGVAVAEYYPQISLAGVLGSESLHGALLSSAAFQPRAVLGLHWRLFDFGRVDAEVAHAQGAKAQALAEYRQSMLRAAEDVENAIVALTQLELQRTDLDREVSSLRVARDAAQDAYEGGAVSLIEVLDEDRELLRARDQQAQLNANNARAAVATFRALGGGWG
jgi:NodT family efflux transporter outer membrane factor (OMF) lipoprotein